MKFEEAFESWYGWYDSTVATRTSRQKHKSLSKYVIPRIGHIALDDITPVLILKLHDEIALTSSYYSRLLINDVIRILDYAVIILQVLEFNKLAGLSKYLKRHSVVGMKYVDIDNLSLMFADFDKVGKHSHRQISCALWTLIYTNIRRSEVVNARKSEFDFANLTWVIPAHRMKITGNGQHIIPLSIQVACLLDDYFKTTDSDWAFPSPTKHNRPINPWSLYFILKQAKWHNKQTLHGFRKIFSTHAHESGLWSIDAIELSLAHKIQGVRGVYNHSYLLDERAELMQWYADEIDRWRGIS